jgi:hypothetical protein
MVLPEIALNAATTPGEGQWAGFELVEVRATVNLSPRRRYQEIVKGYIPRDDGIGEVAP